MKRLKHSIMGSIQCRSEYKSQPVLIWIIAVAILITAGSSTLLTAENQNDTLPIGPSPYKLSIEKIEKDQIIQTSTLKNVTIDDIINQNPETDVFIIGEAHDNFQCHQFQQDFISALYRKYPKLVVGFEFFYREDNPLLELWRNSRISEDELIKKTEWYKRGSLNFGYTWMIMDVIQKNKIKTIGLNVPRTLVRKVSKNGFDALSPEEKKLFPTIAIPNPEHVYFIKNVFGTFAAQVPFWFTNVYMAQKCWDVVMAESMRQLLSQKEFKGYKGVIIAGSNHVAYKLGIPFRYQKADSRVKITTIVPVLMPQEKKKTDEKEDTEVNPMIKMLAGSLKPASTFSRGIADYVFAADQPAAPFFPVIGFSTEEKNGKLVVTSVSKGSFAEKHGIRENDIIHSVEGVPVSTNEQMRILIAKKNWDQEIELGIIKKIEIKREKE